jgi:hypothetical protein
MKYRMPMLRSAPTCTGENGMTAHIRMIIAKAMIGARL